MGKDKVRTLLGEDTVNESASTIIKYSSISSFNHELLASVLMTRGTKINTLLILLATVVVYILAILILCD